MDRTEFTERLQRALAGRLSSSQVAEHVRYYQEYIDAEVRKGRSESEVMEQLGDPRLLARSIIEANKHAGAAYGSGQVYEYDEEVTDDAREWGQNDGMSPGRRLELPGWLVMLIITVLALLVFGAVTYTLIYFAPVIIIALLVVLLVKTLRGRPR